MDYVSILFNGIGLIGTFLYFAVYALLSAGKIDGNGIKYILINMAAATCVLISLIHSWNLPSFIIQTGWIILSLFGIYRVMKLKKLIPEPVIKPDPIDVISHVK